MWLRATNALVYLALTIFAVANVAEPLAAAFRALTWPFSRAPSLVYPWWWLALGAAIAVVVFDLARRLARGVKPGLARFVALLLLCVACIASRRIIDAPAPLPAAEGLAHLIARTQLVADAEFAKNKLYPTDRALLEREFPEALRDLGFFARGARRLPTRVVVVADGTEPVLRAPDGVRPGDVVFALDDTRQRFWITAFTLDRRGRIVPATGEGGRALVSAGAFGRAASRLDTLFPEYPRKNLPGAAQPRTPAAP